MGILQFVRKFKKSDQPMELVPESTTSGFRGGPWIVLAIALMLGVGGVYLANKLIQEQISEKEKALHGQLKTVQVVVPTRDLQRGERVSAGDMSIREVPEDYADRNSVTPDRFETAIGQALVSDLQEGRALLWAHLESGVVPTFSGKLPVGMRAVTVTVDQISSISGMLAPKDRVDLVMTMQDGNKSATFPLLKKVQVLATGTRIEPGNTAQGGQPEAYSTVTLLLSPEDAKKVILAQDSGKMQAVLRNPDDDKPTSDEKITVSALLNHSNSGKQAAGTEYIIGGAGGR